MPGMPSMAEQAAALAKDAREVAELAAVGQKRIPYVGDVGDMTARAWRDREARRIQAAGLPVLAGGSPTARFFEAKFGGIQAREENRVVSQGKAFNLKSVAQVLVEEGYDPTTEVVKILRGTQDPDHPEDPEARRYLVPADVRLRFAAELMKFVHPTKKAVEVEDKTPPLSGHALDARLGILVQQYVTAMGGNLPAEVQEALALVGALEPPAKPFDPYDLL